MQLWNEDGLYLFTREEYNQLPDGTELTSINGKLKTKGIDYIDMDVRSGYIAYGVQDPWNHPLKDLFLIFTLKS